MGDTKTNIDSRWVVDIKGKTIKLPEEHLEIDKEH